MVITSIALRLTVGDRSFIKGREIYDKLARRIGIELISSLVCFCSNVGLLT